MSEQRERAQLRQRRVEVERQQREALEQQQRAHIEREKQQQRSRQGQRHEQQPSVTAQVRSSNGISDQRRHDVGARRSDGENGRFRITRTNTAHASDQTMRETQRQFVGNRRQGEMDRRGAGLNTNSRTVDRQNRGAQTAGSKKIENPFGQRQEKQQSPADLPKRVQAPAFGGGVSGAIEPKKTSDGWGAGAARVAKPQYGDGTPAPIVNENIVDAKDLPDRNQATPENRRSASFQPRQFESGQLPQSRSSIGSGQKRLDLSSAETLEDAFAGGSQGRQAVDQPFSSTRSQLGATQVDRRQARVHETSRSSGWGLDEGNVSTSVPEGERFALSQGALDGLHTSRPARAIENSQQPEMGGSGYQATIINEREYRPFRSASREDHSADWQHLRRRDSGSFTQQAAAQEPARAHQQRPVQNEMSDDWIDRAFLQHQQQRGPPPPPRNWTGGQRDTETYQRQQAQDYSRLQTRQDTSSVVCGRCLQPGHTAPNCPQDPFTRRGDGFGPGSVNEQRRRTPQPRQFDDVFGEQATPYQRGRMSDDPFRDPGRGQSGRTNNTYRDGRSMQQRQSAVVFDEQRAPVEPASSDDSTYNTRVLRPLTTAPPADDREQPARRGRFRDDDANDDLYQTPRTVTQIDNERPTRRGRFRPEDEEDDAISDVQSKLSRRSKFVDEDEEPSERAVRSHKQSDDHPRREKGRGRRRDEDEDEDDEWVAAKEERNARKAARREEQEKKVARAAEAKAKQQEERNQLKLPQFINISTLAQTIGVRYEQFVRRLERLGYDDIFPGKVLNSETSGMIAMEYDYEPVFESATEVENRDLKARPEPEDRTHLPTRPSVVTIMGHVDHGKTTILDYLRKSSVAAGEAGGITQHIGAFSVPLSSSGKTVTFLDTPGHAAFLAMRQRGANVTDIVILVVAADDSVKPQTLEALKHAQAAKVPIIVAVNKIDKAEADLQRVKQDLARHGVEIEDFGGDTQVVPVSGKTGMGMDELEENVVTLSEILDHRAEVEGPVEGWVLEATTKARGRVATVLVRRGTLRTGSVIVAGKTWARVRTLRNEGDQLLQHVGPGMPVEIDGWRDQPIAGDEVLEAPTEQKASDVVEFRLEKEEREKTAQDMDAINTARRAEQEKREKERAAARAAKYAAYTDFFEAAAQSEEPEENVEEGEDKKEEGQISVPFIIKADVSGSAEAVAAYIPSIASPLIVPKILRSTVGQINEGDVELAAAAKGHIIAFNLPTDEGLKGAAEARGVKVLENNIIYRVLDDVKGVLEDRLPPVISQRVLGEAEISAEFEIKIGGRRTMKIAGCKVRNGVVGRATMVRVMRGGKKIFDGTLSSLKNVKKDVQEMRKGTECGMGFEGWEKFEVGDQVQSYEEVSEKRKL